MDVSKPVISGQGWFAIAALIFAVSIVATIIRCASMSAVSGMPMPGGWTMSMVWMRMPGQTWFDAAVSFLGMWIVMMAAMMLPSLVPMLWRYRQALGRTGQVHLERLTVLAGAGYFCVWTAFGLAVFPLGSALATVVMHRPVLAHAVPLAAGLAVLLAGLFQFSAWKQRYLACCRGTSTHNCNLSAGVGAAWRYGLRLGLHCCRCCFGLMLILLVIGVMSLSAMAVMTIAITAERLAPASARAARIIGIIVVGSGLFLSAHALGFV